MIGPGDFGSWWAHEASMIAFSHNPEQIDIHQMGRDVKCASLSAQCRTRMSSFKVNQNSMMMA